LTSFDSVKVCNAGFQTCRIADFQVGSVAWRLAGLETRATADLEVCATVKTVFTPPYYQNPPNTKNLR